MSAVTIDRAGINLPTEFAPWQPLGGGTALSTGAGADPVSKPVPVLNAQL